MEGGGNGGSWRPYYKEADSFQSPESPPASVDEEYGDSYLHDKTRVVIETEDDDGANGGALRFSLDRVGQFEKNFTRRPNSASSSQGDSQGSTSGRRGGGWYGYGNSPQGCGGGSPSNRIQYDRDPDIQPLIPGLTSENLGRGNRYNDRDGERSSLGIDRPSRPPSRSKNTCWNCKGDHMLPDCPEEKDLRRIANNRRVFMANRPQNYNGGGGGGRAKRYHEDQGNAKGRPGFLSDELRRAMGLGPCEVPLYVYRMRKYGYPPGWLDQTVKETSSGLKMYGGSITRPLGANTKGSRINPENLISYEGYNAPMPLGERDNGRDYGCPLFTQEDSVQNMITKLNKDLQDRKKDIDDRLETQNSNERFPLPSQLSPSSSQEQQQESPSSPSWNSLTGADFPVRNDGARLGIGRGRLIEIDNLPQHLQPGRGGISMRQAEPVPSTSKMIDRVPRDRFQEQGRNNHEDLNSRYHPTTKTSPTSTQSTLKVVKKKKENSTSWVKLDGDTDEDILDKLNSLVNQRSDSPVILNVPEDFDREDGGGANANTKKSNKRKHESPSPFSGSCIELHSPQQKKRKGDDDEDDDVLILEQSEGGTGCSKNMGKIINKNKDEGESDSDCLVIDEYFPRPQPNATSRENVDFIRGDGPPIAHPNNRSSRILRVSNSSSSTHDDDEGQSHVHPPKPPQGPSTSSSANTVNSTRKVQGMRNDFYEESWEDDELEVIKETVFENEEVEVVRETLRVNEIIRKGPHEEIQKGRQEGSGSPFSSPRRNSLQPPPPPPWTPNTKSEPFGSPRKNSTPQKPCSSSSCVGDAFEENWETYSSDSHRLFIDENYIPSANSSFSHEEHELDPEPLEEEDDHNSQSDNQQGDDHKSDNEEEEEEKEEIPSSTSDLPDPLKPSPNAEFIPSNPEIETIKKVLLSQFEEEEEEEELNNGERDQEDEPKTLDRSFDSLPAFDFAQGMPEMIFEEDRPDRTGHLDRVLQVLKARKSAGNTNQNSR